MITELIAQWPVNFRRADVQPRKPDAIICSVGGGGLLAGVLAGLKLVVRSSLHKDMTELTSCAALARWCVPPLR